MLCRKRRKRRKHHKRVADGVTGYAGSGRKDTNGGADHQESDQQRTGEPVDDTGKEAPHSRP